MALDFDKVEGRGLVKVYGATRALGGVDVRLDAGTVTAVEGPNGSGKTTLLNLLGLLSRPTGGEIRFGEYGARRAGALRERIGVVGHAAMLYPDLTGVENLLFWARLYRIASPERRLQEVRERFELGPWSERPARTCSRGQLQRLSLARALLHRPRLLLLDEPSAGLDASGAQRLISALQEERQTGAIAVVATHDRALVDAVADRRVRLSRGRVEEQA